VVLISGEPGIGKSRLVEALGAELKVEGCTRITLGCSPYHTNSALYPLIVYFERVLRWQREDGADVKLAKLEKTLQDFSLPLDEAIPLFASLLSLPLPKGRYPPITVTPQRQKQQTLDAIVALLLEEAERQPVLQVWEDLHWADPSTCADPQRDDLSPQLHARLVATLAHDAVDAEPPGAARGGSVNRPTGRRQEAA
jgi:predicted ATPase